MGVLSLSKAACVVGVQIKILLSVSHSDQNKCSSSINQKSDNNLTITKLKCKWNKYANKE